MDRMILYMPRIGRCERSKSLSWVLNYTIVSALHGQLGYANRENGENVLFIDRNHLEQLELEIAEYLLTGDSRVLTAIMLGYTTLVSAFTSSIFSTATRSVAAQYNVSTEVGLLGLSFYVLGFALGPVFWAPLSELKGRRLPLVISMFGFTIFQIAVAAGKDLQTILLCRFWGGESN